MTTLLSDILDVLIWLVGLVKGTRKIKVYDEVRVSCNLLLQVNKSVQSSTKNTLMPLAELSPCELRVHRQEQLLACVYKPDPLLHML